MNNKISRILIVCCLVMVLLSACNLNQSVKATLTPTLTETPLSTFTLTPSPTSTITPSPTPLPVSLQQAIYDGSFARIDEIGKGYIYESKFSPDGGLLAVAASSGLYVFDVATWEEVKFIPAGKDWSIRNITYSRDGSLLAYSEGGLVTIWQTDKFEKSYSIQAYQYRLNYLEISPDGSNLVTTGRDSENFKDTNLLRLWNISDGTRIASRPDVSEMVHYSQDGTWIMAGTTIWTAADLQFISNMKEINYYNLVSPYSNVVVYVDTDVVIYNVDTKQVKTISNPFKNVNWIYDIEFMDFMDTNYLVVKEMKYGQIHKIDVTHGWVVDYDIDMFSQMTIKNPNVWNITRKSEIIGLGFYPYYGVDNISKNGKYVMSEDGIFDVETWSYIPQFTDNTYRWIFSSNLANGDIVRVDLPAEYTKKGRISISYLQGEDLSLISTKSIDCDFKDYIEEVKVSPDGKRLAVGIRNGELYVFDVDENVIIAENKFAQDVFSGFGPPEAFHDLQFSEDGNLLKTRGYDGSMKYWDVLTLERLDKTSDTVQSFVPKEEITDILWVDDLILTIDPLKAWSAEDLSLISDYPLPRTISAFSVNQEGTRLYTSTWDGIISVWGSTP